MSEIEVRDAHGAELVAGCALLARSLAFSERDALPPWLAQTSAAHGGIALAAVDGERVVGFSFALPGRPGELFSCGLAVEPGARGRGVGRRLKLAQRERALAGGAEVIRWTADPLSAPALALYLGGLGARITDYAPELYADVRDAVVPPDDVVIEWRLGEPSSVSGAAAARVEIPLDTPSLSVGERSRWRFAVRREMGPVLEAGGVGTDVLVDRADGRAWVLFHEAA
ncbi:GNAT family N-acetyltransferase [Solirubrobacter phytolaccae]|uniref:GNAT family N-acetyltransferase n=1 Tax=Solirubrobacter phytolaccae TaxID=1404360 RepID=A0A9X3NDC8_9ACTN|nr:GNAT family N-acetyltransferase [Solirubrobacter phytolaccae]MDA0184373.1 GNAT family N-acetyltransferase [Solirubrobacter phytolaccae]